MKQTVNIYSFREAFIHCGRGEQFSYDALEMIFDYLEQYEDDTGEELELDPVAICCEWAEDTPEGIISAYDIDMEGVPEDNITQAVMDFLCDNTTVLNETSSGTLVYVQF